MMFVGVAIMGLIIYLLLKGTNSQSSMNSSSNINNANTSANALEIAKTRLAKGEITAEEYENIKKTLL